MMGVIRKVFPCASGRSGDDELTGGGWVRRSTIAWEGARRRWAGAPRGFSLLEALADHEEGLFTQNVLPHLRLRDILSVRATGRRFRRIVRDLERCTDPELVIGAFEVDRAKLMFDVHPYIKFKMHDTRKTRDKMSIVPLTAPMVSAMASVPVKRVCFTVQYLGDLDLTPMGGIEDVVLIDCTIPDDLTPLGRVRRRLTLKSCVCDTNDLVPPLAPLKNVPRISISYCFAATPESPPPRYEDLTMCRELLLGVYDTVPDLRHLKHLRCVWLFIGGDRHRYQGHEVTLKVQRKLPPLDTLHIFTHPSNARFTVSVDLLDLPPTKQLQITHDICAYNASRVPTSTQLVWWMAPRALQTYEGILYEGHNGP